MFSFFYQAAFVYPSSAQDLECYDIGNYQYGQTCVIFTNICVESSTTNRAATVIELAILVLSLIGIRRASQHRESHLARLLKTQGAIYFVMAASLHVSTMVNDLDPLESDIR